MVAVAIFAVASAGIVAISWSSLRNPRSHGFFRFFAFECILLLILLNAGSWFVEPLSLHQIASWFLLFISIVFAVEGFRLLRIIGRPKGSFEDTTVLVVVGAYKYIRHPMYASLVYGCWGVFFKDPSVLGAVLALGASVFLIVTAMVEERENLGKFGPAYAEYMKNTNRFIPFPFRSRRSARER